ncbi:MAG: ArsI/CadI family heavy metal resistance metalloenzyme [Acidimicrobiales bacterium]
MSRLQLALNVSNLEEAVSFYSTFFKTEPAKVRAGYANFAIAEPPLKLVLFENPEAPGTINHLGVEVFSSEEVVDATTYLSDQGFETDIEVQTSCCHAVQNKVWVDGPDGSRWEVYTVLSDVPASESATEDELCCVPERLSISTKPAACC